MKRITSTFRQIIFAIVFSSAASAVHSQTYSLENPQPGSYQSGISAFSGWACSTDIQILIDGVAYRAAAGTPRSGFPTNLCSGNSNVNFAIFRNFNNFGAGSHTAQLVVDGVNAGSPVTFTVTVPVPSAPFATGLSSTVSVTNFPAIGQTTTLIWQQSAQNFAISAVSAPSTNGYNYAALNGLYYCNLYSGTPYQLQTTFSATQLIAVLTVGGTALKTYTYADNVGFLSGYPYYSRNLALSSNAETVFFLNGQFVIVTGPASDVPNLLLQRPTSNTSCSK